ncbi:TonB-dependent receptor [Povalibacter sp.]|uniref:TonB-dependent receptor n=1 Tax=Povalibacter sp. TaxID=1962978 RepID=UPI002F41A177
MSLGAANAQNAAISSSYIEAQPLRQALSEFAKQTGLQLIYASDDAEGHIARQVANGLTPAEALEQMLDGTGLAYEFVNNRTVRIYSPPAFQKISTTDRAGFTRVAAENFSSDVPSQSSATEAKGATLEEIIVTSRKTEENLQEVPLAITALSSAALENAGVRSIAGVVALTPGLSVNGDSQERGMQPSIRGLSFAGGAGQEGNVAVMLDGIYIANAGAMSLGLMDFERVEIVKGPQSALYGHNAFAGAINYVSKAPPDKLEGKVEVRAGDYDTFSSTASVGGPLVEGLLAARVAVGYDEAGGFFKDPVNGKELGGHEKKNASFSARLTPNDWSTYDLGLYYGDDIFGRRMRANFDYNCAPEDGEFTYYCGELPSTESVLPLVAPNYEPSDAAGNGREVKHARLKATYDLDAVKVDVIFGMFDVKSFNYSEYHGVRDGVPFGLVGGGTVNLPGFFGNKFNNKDYSGEIRVSSHENQPLRWATGVYFYDKDQEVLTNIAYDSDPIPAGREVICPGGYACNWLTPGGRTDGFGGRTLGTTTQTSVFGSLAYDVTDALTVSAEARYTYEEKTSNVITNAIRPGDDADGPDGQEGDWDFVNPRFTANYKLTDDHMLYASAAKGTKAGGFNSSATLADEITYGPENNWTYEIGAKNTLLDGRMRLNVAAFYVDWTELQIDVDSKDLTNPGGVTQNFGSVTAMGGEIEVAAQLFQGVLLNAGVAYTNPEFNDDAYDYGGVDLCLLLPATCGTRVITDAPSPIGPVSAVRLDGLIRPQVSEWQYTLGLDVRQPLLDTWDWFANVNYKYESKQFTEVNNETWVPARHNVGLQLGVENDHLRVTFWAQNLTDDLTPYSTGGGQGLTRWNDFSSVPAMDVSSGRRVGATVNYSF